MQPDFHAPPRVIFGKEKPCAQIENRDGLTSVQEQQDAATVALLQDGLFPT